ncbi:MAG: hypothetical protein CMN30_30955 [Sandaracinus sp.]|nr:hypothetical protein [Sandaracinus sp.]
MRRPLVALLGVLGACGAAQPTVEQGGETAHGQAEHGVEARIDALLQRLNGAVEGHDGQAYAALSDEEGRRVVAEHVFVVGALLTGQAEGEGLHENQAATLQSAQRLAFVAGALFGAHVEPAVAARVNRLGAHILDLSPDADEARREWLFPHVDGPPTDGAPTPDEYEEGRRRQITGALAGLEAANLGRCARSTWIQEVPLEQDLFRAAWGQHGRGIWVARLDCMAEVGMFLFTELADGSVKLLGFRFLSEEAHRDALAILESLEARVAGR